MYTLNNEQKKAVNAPLKPIYVIAGAGTGKTQTISQRVKYLIDSGIKPEKILAITYTRKSTEELGKRIAKANNGETIENVYTFHGFFKNSLETLTEQFKNIKIISSKAQDWLIKKIMKDLKIHDKKEELQNEIENNIQELKRIRRNEKLLNETFWKISTVSAIDQEEIWRKIYEKYMNFLEDNSFFEFLDLEIKIDELLDTDEDFRNKLISKFDAILIDEFQDTSKEHFEIIKKITNSNSNIFFVGDPDQSIYGFRKAIKDSDVEFKNYYKNGEIIILEQNYRSTKPILETANKLIKNNYKNPEECKKLWTEKEQGDKVLYKKFSTPDEERLWIMDEIFHIHKNLEVPLEKIVVLYRQKNRFIEEFENRTNKRYKWKINHLKRTRNFKSFGIRFVIAILFILLKDEVSIFLISEIINFLNKFTEDYKNISNRDIEKFYDISQENKYSFTTAIQNIESFKLSETGKEELKKLGEKIVWLREFNYLKINSWMEIILKNLKCEVAVDEKDQIILERIEKFLLRINRKFKKSNNEQMLMNILTDEEKDYFNFEKSEGLNLSTIHSAKGLEFDYVFLVNMVDGIIPSDKYDSTDEEERRVAYVAFTRAKIKLFITFSPWNKKQEESIFIEEAKDPEFFYEAIY